VPHEGPPQAGRMTFRVKLIALVLIGVAANLAVVPSATAANALFGTCDNKKSCSATSDCSAGGSSCTCFPNPLGPHCYSVAVE